MGEFGIIYFELGITMIISLLYVVPLGDDFLYCMHRKLNSRTLSHTKYLDNGFVLSE